MSAGLGSVVDNVPTVEFAATFSLIEVAESAMLVGAALARTVDQVKVSTSQYSKVPVVEITNWSIFIVVLLAPPNVVKSISVCPFATPTLVLKVLCVPVNCVTPPNFPVTVSVPPVPKEDKFPFDK